MIAISIVAKGDTLKLTNNSSLNGTVRYEQGIFYIEAHYKGVIQHYKIPRDLVRSDEINRDTFNQGAPQPDIRAHQVDRYEWVALKTQNGPSTGTRTQRTVGSAKTAQRTAPIRNTATVGAVVEPIPASSYSAGEDTLTFTDKKSQTGTLRRITEDIIIFRANGERKDTEYARDRVKLVEVKKSE